MISLKPKNLPNLITLARLVAVPAIVWLMLIGRMTEAFWLFVVAGVSDAVDGYLAKRWKADSVLGSYLDPLADKILLIGVYIVLASEGHLPPWLIFVVILRDTGLLAGSIYVLTGNRRVAMRPMFISKLNTTLQIVLAALVMARLGLGFPDIGLGHDVLVYAVGITTVWSGAAYFWRMKMGDPTGNSVPKMPEGEE